MFSNKPHSPHSSCLIWWLGKLQSFKWSLKSKLQEPFPRGNRFPLLLCESSTLPLPQKLIWQIWARSILVEKIFYQLICPVRSPQRGAWLEPAHVQTFSGKRFDVLSAGRLFCTSAVGHRPLCPSPRQQVKALQVPGDFSVTVGASTNTWEQTPHGGRLSRRLLGLPPSPLAIAALRPHFISQPSLLLFQRQLYVAHDLKINGQQTRYQERWGHSSLIIENKRSGSQAFTEIQRSPGDDSVWQMFTWAATPWSSRFETAH